MESQGVFCGEKGQIIWINNEKFFLGDVVLLTHRKTKDSQYYKLVFDKLIFAVCLHNENNLIQLHPFAYDNWTSKNYRLYEVEYIPYVEMIRIGNDKKYLKKVVRIKNRKCSKLR